MKTPLWNTPAEEIKKSLFIITDTAERFPIYIYIYVHTEENMQLYSFLQIVKFIAHLPNTLGRLFLNVPRYISTNIWFLK